MVAAGGVRVSVPTSRDELLAVSEAAAASHGGERSGAVLQGIIPPPCSWVWPRDGADG